MDTLLIAFSTSASRTITCRLSHEVMEDGLSKGDSSFTLPGTSAIDHLHDLLDRIIRLPRYFRNLDRYSSEARRAFHDFQLLTEEGTIIEDPPRRLGQVLYGWLFPPGRVGDQQVRRWLETPSNDINTPRVCLILDFSALQGSELCRDILALPWETLCEPSPERPDQPPVLEPLCRKGCLILRRYQGEDLSGLEVLKQRPVVLPLLPRFRMDNGKMRSHRVRARPIGNVTPGQEPWCDYQEPEHGLTYEQLKERIQLLRPHIFVNRRP